MNPIFLFRSSARRSTKIASISWPTLVMGLLLTAATFGLNSCGTARGFGSDVEKTGEKIEEAATR
jgi:predicted small secreted protein